MLSLRLCRAAAPTRGQRQRSQSGEKETKNKSLELILFLFAEEAECSQCRISVRSVGAAQLLFGMGRQRPSGRQLGAAKEMQGADPNERV